MLGRRKTYKEGESTPERATGREARRKKLIGCLITFSNFSEKQVNGYFLLHSFSE